MRSRLCAVIAALAAGLSLNAAAQTTAGAGTVIVLPLVADIPGAYVTTVFAQNTHGTPITLDVTYHFSHAADTNIADTSVTCNQVTIGANSVATFDPYTQCNLGTLLAPPNTPYTITDIFGTLILDDAASPKTNTFFAYARTAVPANAQTLQPNNGFSVEGFPVGNFSSKTSSAIGLQGSTTAPHFRSNCFIGSLGETVDWQLILRDANGVPIGNSLSGTLGPYQNTRILNVYAAVNGAPYQTNYDYSNVRATFYNNSTSPSGSAMIGFCTVESSDNGSADFRIAKSDDANDVRQSRQACYGMDSCGSTSSGTNPARLASSSTKNIHYTILDQPDFVQCTLVSTTVPGSLPPRTYLGDLEILLRGPGGDPQSAPTFTLPAGYNGAPYSVGGPAATSFYIYTGEKSTIAPGGATTRWYIDVSGNQSSPNLAADLAATASAGGIPYGITCTSGNGITVPWLGTTGPANP